MRRFPRGSQLKCLTAFVTYTVERSMPAASRARSRTRPAGPTNGCPVRSSSSPGCSPTSTTVACAGPAPKTVCVARRQRSQPLQSAAAAFAVASVGRTGTNGRADFSRLIQLLVATPVPRHCEPLEPLEPLEQTLLLLLEE